MNREYVYRIAKAEDAPVIARQRALMFRDIEALPDDQTELLRLAAEPWLSALLIAGQYIGWLVEDQGVAIAGGGAFLMDLGPGPGRYRMGRGAHIANIYTDPAYRRRGIARRLMRIILDWFDSNAIDQVTLAASDEGRALYESLGFQPTNDMRLKKTNFCCG